MNMNGKMQSNKGAYTSDDRRAEILNPFVHKLELDSTYDKLKTALFTVILLPFRVIVICGLVIAAWALACIGLYGLTDEDLRTKPMIGWRRKIRFVVCGVMRVLVMSSGFHDVRVRGKAYRASARQAPVLCVAPHSSFFDAIAMVMLDAPSVVAKAETARMPFFGKLINYTQPVYVWRDDPNSRQNTIREIIERATCTNQDWPQVLIFPEGTCTNRSCLITFKPGGFYPGVPVQPVTIRYPNNLDTVTWTWEGPGALKLLWLTLTQVHSSCEIEFLPVYYPSAEEKRDPKLYARNVRDVMANALGIPVLDYTYDDCRLMTRAKHLNIPGSSTIVEIQKLRYALGLEASSIERHIVVNQRHFSEFVDCATFAQRLGIHPNDAQTQKLFDIFKQKQSGLVLWRDYLMCASFLTLQQEPLSQLLIAAFKIYDTSGTGRLNIQTFSSAVTRSIGMCQEDALNTFQQADQDEKGFFTADEFLEFAQKKTELSYLFNNN